MAGGAGSGKTLLGLQFLVAGAREYGEPGVLLTFEESTAKVSANVASLGFDLDGLQRDQLLVADAFRVDPGLAWKITNTVGNCTAMGCQTDTTN